ncbi:hypothetical protein VTJ49DRAFT_7040 [Mycothermus thermophilus]|uniref:Ribosome-assembly protein 3 C-terminal domain-containing protein n=1 Tax=Humicola insolens TaxID=85995 RepID=A0ABR3V0M5_HUMIN
MAPQPPSPSPTPEKSDKEVAAEFTSYYLQRATKEFAEDLDKNDALHVLIGALQQGTALFSPEEQRRIVTTAASSTRGA